jgi:hypothetical protein
MVAMTNSSREPFRPTLASDADVTTLWRTIISPLGWHTRRLYIVFVDPDGRPNPQVVEVDEMPDGFDREAADVFVDFLGHIVRDVDDVAPGSAALMFARPGSASLTEDDRALCRELYAAAQRSGVRLELVHVGTDTAIVPAPMDEVLPRSA